MPHKDPDLQDPMMLVGVEVDCPAVSPAPAEPDASRPDASATQAMAECFVEEFLRMGVAPDELLELFRQPVYAAAHQAYRELGEEAIRDLVEAYRKVWRPIRIIDS